MKKNIPRLGIEPQNCILSWIETWCLSPLDHEISIGKWLIYQYINIGKSSTKPPKCPNLVLFFWSRQMLKHCFERKIPIWRNRQWAGKLILV